MVETRGEDRALGCRAVSGNATVNVDLARIGGCYEEIAVRRRANEARRGHLLGIKRDLEACGSLRYNAVGTRDDLRTVGGRSVFHGAREIREGELVASAGSFFGVVRKRVAAGKERALLGKDRGGK